LVVTGGLVERIRAQIADPRQIPSLHDLLQSETAALVEKVNTSAEFALETPYSDDALAARTTALEDASRDLVRACGWGGMYGFGATRTLWPLIVGQLANTVLRRSHGHDVWHFLHLYPAVLAAYAVGMGAVVGERHSILAALLSKKVVLDNKELTSVPSQLHATSAFLNTVANRLPDLGDHQTAASDRAFGYLSRLFAVELTGGEPLFAREFDRFEYLMGLVRWDESRGDDENGWAPWGRHVWRREDGVKVEDEVIAEINRMGTDWPLLRNGLFRGSKARLDAAVEGYRNQRRR
jgi:hypothetical protein